MMDAGNQQLFYSAKCSVLRIHPNAVQVWMCPYGFLKNANMKSSSAVTATGSKAVPVCVIAIIPPQFEMSAQDSDACQGYHKKVFVHFSLLGARFCHSPKETLERKLSLLHAQLTWEREVGPLMSQTVTKSPWVKDEHSCSLCSHLSVKSQMTFPKSSALVMFTQYGSVFLTWRCPILECSVADK